MQISLLLIAKLLSPSGKPLTPNPKKVENKFQKSMKARKQFEIKRFWVYQDALPLF